MPNILRFALGDILELKKPHPCGNRRFTVLRVGSEMRIRCLGCDHDMVIDRIKLEKAVKRLTPAPSSDQPSTT